MHQAIADAGLALWQHNGTWLADDEAAVQAIINGFDPLPGGKREKLQELKEERRKRIATLFDEDDFEFMLAEALGRSWRVQQGRPLPADTPSLDALESQFMPIADAYRAAQTAINALTTYDAIKNYDVVNTPSWPA